MTKNTIITSLPGSDIDTFLNNELEVFKGEAIYSKTQELKKQKLDEIELNQEIELERKRVEDKFKVYHIGEIMKEESFKMNFSYNFNYILQLPQDSLRMLTRIAWQSLEKKIKQENPDVALIKAHASFYDPHTQQFKDGLFNNDFDSLQIDRMCCVIDDEELIRRRLEEKDQYKNMNLTKRRILEWITQEMNSSDRLFTDLKIKNKSSDMMQVFSRYMSTTSLYKYIMFEDTPVIYTIYPMTAVHSNKSVEKEINEGIWMANSYGIVKNPKAGDMATQTTGELILGHIDRGLANEDALSREKHCVHRDLHYLVDKSHIIFGNYPIDTYSDGMISEAIQGSSQTKFVILKVGKDTKSEVSPFRTFPASYIEREYSEIEKRLQNEGFQPKFKDLMSRWEEEYNNITR